MFFTIKKSIQTFSSQEFQAMLKDDKQVDDAIS